MKRVAHGPPRLTLKEWLERLEEFNHQCAYCSEPLEGMGWIEHMQPLSRGGYHRKENVVPACQKCNQEKGNMTLEEYKAKVLASQGD